MYDSTIIRIKAPLVIHYVHQLEAFDFNETLVLVAKMTNGQTCLSVTVVEGWELH